MTTRPTSRDETAALAPRDIFEALRHFHELQRTLCTRMVRLSPSRPQLRQQVFRELRIELAAHAAAEERYLYVPMLMSDIGLDPSRHAIAEHHEIDELCEEIESLDPAGQAWSERARALSHQVRHHLKEEEHRFFQMAGRILTDAKKKSLAGQYLRDHARMKKKLSAA